MQVLTGCDGVKAQNANLHRSNSIIRAKQSREIYEFYNKRQDIAQKRYKGHRYEAKSQSLVDLLCLCSASFLSHWFSNRSPPVLIALRHLSLSSARCSLVTSMPRSFRSRLATSLIKSSYHHHIILTFIVNVSK